MSGAQGLSTTLDLPPASASPTTASKGSSFNLAMRILPARKRDAMLAIYAFCRAVDDIADDRETPRPARAAALDRWRKDIDALYDGASMERLAWLQKPIVEFRLNRKDFQAVIDGMQMDVDADIRAPDPAVLDLYCDRVASAVGRLSVRIFGMPAEDGEQLAYHLGRALQLTNILRDIDEDAGIGRLYLPNEALQHAHIFTTDPQAVMAAPTLGRACEPLVVWARHHYAEARRIMARCPRAATRCPAMMADVYGSILDRLVARGFEQPRKRVRTPRLKLLAALFRYGIV